MVTGIRDKVVILGMGCSRFGERWDAESAQLMAEAFQECLQDAGIEKNEIQAAWFASAIESVNVGPSGSVSDLQEGMIASWQPPFA
jgi:acetyl-CoA C-acetyltransferase